MQIAKSSNAFHGKVLKNTKKCRPANTHGTNDSMCEIGQYSFLFAPRWTASHSASYGLIGKRYSIACTTPHFAVFRFLYEMMIANHSMVSAMPAVA